jgi:hypothetical protein
VRDDSKNCGQTWHGFPGWIPGMRGGISQPGEQSLVGDSLGAPSQRRSVSMAECPNSGPPHTPKNCSPPFATPNCLLAPPGEGLSSADRSSHVHTPRPYPRKTSPPPIRLLGGRRFYGWVGCGAALLGVGDRRPGVSIPVRGTGRIGGHMGILTVHRSTEPTGDPGGS